LDDKFLGGDVVRNLLVQLARQADRRQADKASGCIMSAYYLRHHGEMVRATPGRRGGVDMEGDHVRLARVDTVQG
jgi:hypothetical protein